MPAKIIRYFTTVIFLIVIANFDAVSQKAIDTSYVPVLRIRYGIFGSYNQNNYSADFSQLPGVLNCCPHFTDGSGTGYTAGILTEKPYSDDLLVQLRMAFSDLSGNMSSKENKILLINDQPANSTTAHKLNIDLNTIELQAKIAYQFLDELALMAGFSFGAYAVSSYDQYEELVYPENSTFDNGMITRYHRTGSIRDASTFFAEVDLGLGYDIALDKYNEFLLTPEVFYSYYLTPVVPIIDWNISALKAGIALKYSPIFYRTKITGEELYDEPVIIFEKEELAVTRPEEKTKEIPPASDKNKPKENIAEKTETAKKEIPAAREKEITKKKTGATDTKKEAPLTKQTKPVKLLVMADKKGEFVPVDTLVVRKIITTEYYPLLDYIFFEKGSSLIDEKYQNALNISGLNKIEKDKSQKSVLRSCYYSIIDIISDRLKSNPGEKITLTGCNSGNKTENENIKLSEKRAKNLAQYIISKAGIDGARIKTRARELPANPSNNETPEGSAENRRVEINASWKILKPFEIKDTATGKYPEQIRLQFKNINPENYSDLNLELTGGNGKTGVIHIKKSESKYIDLNLNNIINDFSKKKITFSLKDGNKTIAKHVITTAYAEETAYNRIPGINKVEKYSLVLFDYDSYRINDINNNIINIINKKISENSKVTVVGYADETGDESYNKVLSEKRAAAVAKKIKAKNVKTIGKGEKMNEQFKADSPERRFYSRMVTVTVQ